MKKIILCFSISFFIFKSNAQTNCAGTLSLTVTPPPPVAGYAPGTTVNFCLSMDGFNQNTANWFHGVGINYGVGWDSTTINPYSPAASCDGYANWAWYDSCVSSATGITWGPGYYCDSPLGSPSGILDSIPGNNFGDNCMANIWTFCWSIQTSSTATSGIPLVGTIIITGDGTTGSWSSPDCGGSYLSFNSLLGSNSCAASFFYSAIPIQNIPLNFFNASAGLNLSYLWTFGDGDSSILANPVHTYSQAGNYNLCLYINSTTGCSDFICTVLHVVNSNWWNNPYYITGSVFYDSDSNGVFGIYETGLQNWNLNLLPANNYNLSTAGGNYYFPVDTGDYIISFTPHSNWALTTDSSVYHVHIDTASGSLSGFNFGFKPTQQISDFQLYFDRGVPTCLWNASQFITITNTGTNYLDGIIKYDKHDSVIFVSSSPVPDSVIQNSYYWHYTHLPPFQSQQVSLIVDKPNTVGYQFWSIAYADARDTANNIILYHADTASEIVTCAYDPNVKEISPVTSLLGQNYTLIGQSLTYTIRFQNTGNDTAVNVIILDTLSSNLDINTFQYISSSAPVDIHYTANGIITFIFYNINLPDSITNELASHGFVTFSVEAISGISNNTLIQNIASIYFDQNSAIQTNFASTTMVNTIPTGFSNIAENIFNLNVLPNPTTGNIFITTTLAFPGLINIDVLNVLGQKIYSTQYETGKGNSAKEISLQSLSSGIYLIKAKVKDILKTFRIVKLDK